MLKSLPQAGSMGRLQSTVEVNNGVVGFHVLVQRMFQVTKQLHVVYLVISREAATVEDNDGPALMVCSAEGDDTMSL